MTLAAVAKCLQATTWLVARGNKSAEVIADKLEEDLAEIEKVIKAQRIVGSYDIRQICMAMVP